MKMKRVGWIVLGWTGRAWIPYHETAARTRTAALTKWRRPFGMGGGWFEWERRLRAGVVRAVRTYIDDEPGRHIDGGLL